MKQTIFRHAVNAAFLALLATATSCGGNESATADETAVDDPSTPDRAFFELVDDVKEARTLTYWRVTQQGDSLVADTTAATRTERAVYFDKRGNYLAKEHETVKRDSLDRIVRWEDHRPNATAHPGFLRDTLAYDFSNINALTVTGMGERATVVRDDRGNIVGQYATPLTQGANISAINVIKATDKHGNWTERLTVWTTHTPGNKPHVSYTIDRRTIIYY